MFYLMHCRLQRWIVVIERILRWTGGSWIFDGLKAIASSSTRISSLSPTAQPARHHQNHPMSRLTTSPRACTCINSLAHAISRMSRSAGSSMRCHSLLGIHVRTPAFAFIDPSRTVIMLFTSFISLSHSLATARTTPTVSARRRSFTRPFYCLRSTLHLRRHGSFPALVTAPTVSSSRFTASQTAHGLSSH
jgi:hypothetical protein